MSGRTARVLAWGTWALFVLLAGATVALVVAGSGDGDQAFVLMAIGFATVGALIASREPANTVGWLLLAIAVSFAFQGLADAYLGRAGHPGEVAVAWFANWAWYVWLYAAGLLLPLVFPDGRLLSPRWRPVLWMGVGALGLAIITEGLGPGRLDVESPEDIQNPLGIGGLLGDVLGAGNALSNVLAATGFVLGAFSLVLRLRRSRGRERQQLKLFAYVGGLALAGLVVAMGEVFAGPSAPMWVRNMGGVGWLTALMLILVGLPVAVGIAILRHRLYDIDVVINRTLVYGALTILLAASYLGMVLLFQLVLNPITSESDLAVAASTLAVAALFRPLR
ncbi:MAG: hypothetical protein H0V23_13145, partial [Nocardioidaceae bacterium]|nr:hypothetical protein [Nocardioidaceae bacterium]